MIRKEARRILAAGKASAEGSARHGGAVAAAAGFALEGAGLHFQRSWHEARNFDGILGKFDGSFPIFWHI